jgi:8-oxo-dGTP pyrophosphatase MutT (NUDIX family)
LPNEEHVDAAIREMFEETGLTLTPDDLSMLSNNPVRMSLLEGKHQLVCVYSASHPVLYVIANLRTHAKVEQALIAHYLAINHDGTSVVPKSNDIDGFPLTPTKIGSLPAIIRKLELLHFAYLAQWETFRRAVITNQLLCHDDTSLPRDFLF